MIKGVSPGQIEPSESEASEWMAYFRDNTTRARVFLRSVKILEGRKWNGDDVSIVSKRAKE